MPEETIAAVATPPGEGAVGVIRLSGKTAVEVADRVFHSLHGKKSLAVESRRNLWHGVAVAPGTGEILDEVLVAVARGPRSYTGEDVVEFFCHGGELVLGRVLDALLAAGARPARPGEFTERAFLNGRIDLPQAEAVVDLVRARSDEARRAAVGSLLGGLAAQVKEVKEGLVAVLAHLEAALDFPEEEVPPLAWEDVTGALAEAEGRIGGLLAGARRGRLYREGLRVALVGRPNVGKSSLLNALVGRERAIVTGVPGTTRDVLEEGTVWAGVPVCLVDTAGLRPARDVVEEEGVRRARREVAAAGVVVLVLDGSEPLRAEDREAAAGLAVQAVVVAVNKADLPQAVTERDVEELLPDRRAVSVSARTGAGLPALEGAVLATAGVGAAGQAGAGAPRRAAGWEGRQDVLVTRARQEEALRRAKRDIVAAQREAGRAQGEELIAARVRGALHALGELTGESVDDEVRRAIFSTFCLGK